MVKDHPLDRKEKASGAHRRAGWSQQGGAMKHPVGHPAEPIRLAWSMRFGLTNKQRKRLTDAFCWQLCLCRDDAARRLLLGVSA